jgi:hypothetical protein
MESIVTPGSGHLKLTGSHGEVCPELARLYYPRLKYRSFFRLSRRALNAHS